MLKYIILYDESKVMPDETLVYRIEAVRDFGTVRKGDKGGFVRDGENLSHHGNCWITDEAVAADFSFVQGNAVLSGKAKLLRFAWIAGNAHVTDRVLMTDYTSAYGNAFLGGVARFCEGASVFENGHVKTAWRRGWTMRGLTTVRGNARLIDKAFMQDRSLLDGDAVLRKLASLRENARVDDHADIGGSSRISGDAWVTGRVSIRDRSQVTGNAIVHGRVVVCGKSYITGKVRICGNQHYQNVILSGDQILF